MKKRKISKDSAYERYKKRLLRLTLSPEEYEKRLREWCKRHNM